MKSLYQSFFVKLSKNLAFLWASSVLLLIANHLYHLRIIGDSFLFVALLAAVLMSFFFTAIMKIPQYLRLHSRTVRDTWISLLKLQALLQIFNLTIFALVCLAFRYDWFSLVKAYPGHSLWIIVAINLISAGWGNYAIDPRARWNQPVQSFFLGLLACGWSSLIVYYVITIPAIGFALLVSSIWINFCLRSLMLKQSYTLRDRKRFAIVGTSIALLAILMTAALDREFSGTSSQHSKWTVTDVEKSTSVDQWLDWYQTKNRDLTSTEAIRAIVRLTEVCHKVESDDGRDFLCQSSKQVDEENDHVSLFDQKWTDDDLRAFLSSSVHFANMVGVVEARKRPVIDSGMRILIEAQMKKSDGLSLASKYTLSDQPNKRSHIYVGLISENRKPASVK